VCRLGGAPFDDAGCARPGEASTLRLSNVRPTATRPRKPLDDDDEAGDGTEGLTRDLRVFVGHRLVRDAVVKPGTC
jgi:hypothetical protein